MPFPAKRTSGGRVLYMDKTGAAGRRLMHRVQRKEAWGSRWTLALPIHASRGLPHPFRTPWRWSTDVPYGRPSSFPCGVYPLRHRSEPVRQRRTPMRPPCPHCDDPTMSVLRLALLSEILRTDETRLVLLADLWQQSGLLLPPSDPPTPPPPQRKDKPRHNSRYGSSEVSRLTRPLKIKTYGS